MTLKVTQGYQHSRCFMGHYITSY